MHGVRARWCEENQVQEKENAGKALRFPMRAFRHIASINTATHDLPVTVGFEITLLPRRARVRTMATPLMDTHMVKIIDENLKKEIGLAGDWRKRWEAMQDWQTARRIARMIEPSHGTCADLRTTHLDLRGGEVLPALGLSRARSAPTSLRMPSSMASSRLGGGSWMGAHPGGCISSRELLKLTTAAMRDQRPPPALHRPLTHHPRRSMPHFYVSAP